MTKRKAFALFLFMPIVFTACGDESPTKVGFESGLSRAAMQYKDELRVASVSNGPDGGYVVEGDIWLPDDEAFNEFYEQTYGSREAPKSIVNIVGGVRDLRPIPTEIKYCFAAGWGTNIDVNGGGTTNPPTSPDYRAPPIEPTRGNIQAGMRQWEDVANVRFVYMSSLDGAGCTNTGVNPGVSFVVQHYFDPATPNTAFGPFPSNPWASQKLRVPPSGIGTFNFAAHEIGHALGFRHEHIHSGATPRCAEDALLCAAVGASTTGKTCAELTVFDTSSVMKYFNCTVSGNINGTAVSSLDGVGARELFGMPVSWYVGAAVL